MAHNTVGVVSLRTRARPGVYWDEHNFERACVIVEVFGMFGRWMRLGALDASTGERLLDPPSAIPLSRPAAGDR